MDGEASPPATGTTITTITTIMGGDGDDSLAY